MKFIVFSIAMIVLVVNSARSHDFWIEPTTFQPELGETVGVHLQVGMNFDGEIVARMSNWFDRFEYLIGADGNANSIPGKEWNDPAGEIVVKEKGLYLLGFQSHHQAIVIDPATFTFYLKEEGLDEIVKMREARGESESKGNEIFLRCCKTIIPCETDDYSGYDRPLGFKLELIPQKNPLTLDDSEELPVKLLFMGEPVANVMVAALEKDNPTKHITARTDADGMVSLKIPYPGHWLIKAVHMTEVEEESVNADWQSFWASYVFHSK